MTCKVFKLKQSLLLKLLGICHVVVFFVSHFWKFKSDKIASNFCRLIIWLKQDKIGSNWIKLDQTWSNWNKIEWIGSNLMKLDQIDQIDLIGIKLIEFDHIGPNWIKLEQIGSYWIRLDQIGSDWIKGLFSSKPKNWQKFRK